MKPFTKTKLLKTITSEWDLEDPVWIDEDTLSFYVPTWFNVDEFIEGLNIDTTENEDYINAYLQYLLYCDDVQLILVYVNESGYNEGYKDFEITVELDEKSKELFKEKIQNEWQQLLNKEVCL